MDPIQPAEGTFAEAPFASILFDLWDGGKTGRFEVRTRGGARVLHLLNGDVVVEREGLAEKDFLSALAKKNVLTADQVRQCAREAKAGGRSLLKTLSESGLLSPLPLWNLMESFYARRLFTLFEAEAGDWEFHSGDGLPVRDRLGAIPSQDLIVQGTRQIQNAALIERFLPEDGAPIRVAAPARLHRIAWESHERYALQVLGSVPNLRAFHEACQIGRREARKTLFAFLCLGILTASASKSKARPAGGPEAMNAGRAFEILNEKCAFVYKYLTREIGPLGRTMITRALEEARPELGPLFQKMALLSDGRVSADTAVSHNAGRLPGELTRALLRGYEEILVSEVLAVKKALGPQHETDLVKALEKIG
ncbi:MAG: DUF4388 domain-containing protein [Candidatus Aminicenantales bacterium]|jgi:hypothetical protein